MKTNGRLPWHKYQAYREVIAHPDSFQGERFSLAQLKQAARNSEILFRGWPFIYVPDTGFELHDKSVPAEINLRELWEHDYFERWELHQSGLFFHRALMGEASRPAAIERGKVLDFTTTIYHISEAIGSIWHLYMALGVPDDEYITITFRYTDMAGRSFAILDRSRGGTRRHYSPSGDKVIERSRRLLLASWRSADADIARDIAIEVFERAGWEQPSTDAVHQISHEFLARPA